MTGVAQLSLASAVRWALVWPAGVLAACLAAGIVLLARSGGEFAFDIQVHSPYGVPQGVVVAVVVGGLLLGPPLAFLLVWKVTQR